MGNYSRRRIQKARVKRYMKEDRKYYESYDFLKNKKKNSDFAHTHFWRIVGISQVMFSRFTATCRLDKRTIELSKDLTQPSVETTALKSDDSLLMRTIVTMNPETHPYDKDNNTLFIKVLPDFRNILTDWYFTICDCDGKVIDSVMVEKTRYHRIIGVDRNLLAQIIKSTKDEIMIVVRFDFGLQIEESKKLCSHGQKQSIYCYKCKKMESEKLFKSEISKLFLLGVNDDFHVIVGDQCIKVHKFILKNKSPYFAALLEQECIETRDNRLIMKDIDFECLRNIIGYFYTSELDLQFVLNSCVEFLVVAHRLMLSELVSMAEQMCRAKVSKKTVLTYFKLANIYDLPELLGDCIFCIQANHEAIKNKKTYIHLQECYPSWMEPVYKNGAGAFLVR